MMSSHDVLEKLQSVLKSYKTRIVYSPLPDEVDYRISPIFYGLAVQTFVISHDKNVNPFDSAKILCESCSVKTCIILPGSAFDSFGTRHGRGGGWYDRFLSRVPREWLRVGIVGEPNFSHTPIERKPWDEPVDWVLVFNPLTSSWVAYETFVRHS